MKEQCPNGENCHLHPAQEKQGWEKIFDYEFEMFKKALRVDAHPGILKEFWVNNLKSFIRTELQAAKEEGRLSMLEEIKLWRPVFYRDKVTEEDLKALAALTKKDKEV